MAKERYNDKGYNYPTPTPLNVPYESPPPSANPVVRGLPLYYAASLVTSVSIVPAYLWRNGGFAHLRGVKELGDVECRFDPTVIPVADFGVTLAPKYTEPGGPRSSSLDRTKRYYSILDFHEDYRSGKLTPTAVVDALLPLISRDVEAPTQHSTAFLETRVDLVRKAAEASTLRYKEGKPLGVLDGVPVGVKDEVDVKGYKTRNGSKREPKEIPDATSWCVAKWEEEGAIVLGKMNMHELGMGTSNNNPIYGTPLNPHNEHYYTGGSSGGSAYAVSAGLAPIALGTDGGGSVRIPCSYCGIFGLKPSHGRVSALPTVNGTNTTTVYGPLTSNMTDLEVAYRVMASPNPSDPTSSLFPAPRPYRGSRTKLLGVYQTWFDRAEAPVRRACQSVLDYLTSAHDYTVVPITIPLIHDGQTAHSLTILSEAAACCPDLTGLTPDNRILFAVAAHTPATDFLLAQKLRNLLMRHLAHLFTEHPGLVIVTPTTPHPGWHISGGKSDLRYGISDGNTIIRSMEYVWLANFTGVPAINVPAGYVDPVEGTGKIPIGLTGMGEWGSEDALIEFGYDCETWLNEKLEGGRRRPKNWVDVLKIAGEAGT